MSDMDRDDDRYGRSAFDPVMVDDMDTYDATDEEEEPASRGWLMLLVVLVVLAALAGVVYFAYQQGREEGIRTAPPIVRAEGGPEKVAPQDPGGMEIPHQDKEIFERITGDTTSADPDTGVERLLPPPEEPATIPAAPSAPEAPAAAEAPPDNDAAAPTETAAASPVESPAPTPTPTPVPAAPPAAAPAPAPAATEGWVVQIGAFRDQARAQTEWAGLQSRHATILAGATADVQRADLGDRGIWYRLRAATYATKGAADTVCGQLKAAGTDCLVRRR